MINKMVVTSACALAILTGSTLSAQTPAGDRPQASGRDRRLRLCDGLQQRRGGLRDERRRRQGHHRPARHLSGEGRQLLGDRAQGARQDFAEQNFSNSDRADASSAAKIGKLLGVDAIIVGSVTQFGNDTKNTGIGGVGAGLGKVGIGGFGQKQSKAVVGINARLVNVDTGEIVGVAEGKGESKRTSTTMTGGGGGWGGFGAGGVNFGASDFQRRSSARRSRPRSRR